MGSQNNNPDDHSCLLAMNLTDHMFEFRYHEDQVGYFYQYTLTSTKVAI